LDKRPTLRVAVCVVAAVSLLSAGAGATDVTTVSSCPQQARIPVTFTIDCSHLKNAANKALCRPFIENVACKVFPAYRKITGLTLETRCPLMLYTIYEETADWPHKGTPSGGMSYKCRVDYMARYSILYRSVIGPYDVHEILHHYHFALPPLPNQHSLFEPAMLEARRDIGDIPGFENFLAHAKASLNQGFGNNCYVAQSLTEKSLYIEDQKNVYRFYRELDGLPMDPNQRLNRLLLKVAGQKASVRKFLTDHGCPAFH
jgi:hypothetical protein